MFPLFVVETIFLNTENKKISVNIYMNTNNHDQNVQKLNLYEDTHTQVLKQILVCRVLNPIDSEVIQRQQPHLLSLVKDVKFDFYTVHTWNRIPGHRKSITLPLHQASSTILQQTRQTDRRIHLFNQNISYTFLQNNNIING